MKKHAMIILILLFVSIPTLTFADTCPPVRQFPAPTTPPAGWATLVPAIFPGDNYRFSSAIHSLNSTYYPLQVLCVYECAPDAKGCSPFTIVSNGQYRQPSKSVAPWNVLPQLVNTLVCSPANHDPQVCTFDNIPPNQSG